MRSDDLLAIYLNNHLGAATGGVELFRRVARQHRGTPDGAELDRLVGEVVDDRTSLRRLMARLDVKEHRTHQALMWTAERIGRLKPNGYIVSRSPLSDVVEMEALRAAVGGKLSLWQTLLAVTVREPRLDRAELESLIERAVAQLDRLHDVHMRIARSRVEELVDSHDGR